MYGSPKQANITNITQRLKGAIDTRIAEEQARQRQAVSSATPQRGQPRRRGPGGQDGRGSRVASRQREPAATQADKSPDPSEFEPAFSIGDDDSAVPSRTATPLPEGEGQQSTPAAAPKEQREDDKPLESTEVKPQNTNGVAPAPLQTAEIPPEIRTRLRRLDRLEAKYGELLKAYRAAHGKVQTIEPFEASLREYTPLTSIGDPPAFVEFLGQITAKSDMILDEFKRVSAERDDYKKKAEQAEDNASQLRTELAQLKASSTEGEETVVAASDKDPAVDDSTKNTVAPTVEPADTPASPTSSIKSPASIASRIPSISLFSPRTKPVSGPIKEASEDLFSYDSEVPRLEQELHDSQAQVETLSSQMEKLRGDLTVARESTEGMVTTLESATQELHDLRDANDKLEMERTSLSKRIIELESQQQSSSSQNQEADRELIELRGQKEKLSTEIDSVKQQVAELEQQKSELQAQMTMAEKNVTILNEKLAQKDSVVKDLEDSLAMAKMAAREDEKKRTGDESSEKKLSTMQNIMDTLRSQLKSAETTMKELREEIVSNQSKFDSQPSTKVFGFLNNDPPQELEKLKTREDVVNYLAANFGLRRDFPSTNAAASKVPSAAASANPSAAPSDAGLSQTSAKKKNKKKKKGKGAQNSSIEEVEPDVPIKVSENLAAVEDEDTQVASGRAENVTKLEQEISEMRESIARKDAAVDNLSKKLKDQEALQEEIETLRDDLLHQGEEHVEARDKLKTAETERRALQEKTVKLEQELLDLQKTISSNSGKDEDHRKTMTDFEELRVKSISMQTDLTAAEQLAASRFKELSELREVISKAQPELKNLRTEVADLKKSSEDLKNKEGELKRLESRHDDLKAEIKGMGKRLSDKDSEIKELQQKIDQETSTRTRIEEDLRSTQTELKSTEARRQDAASNASNTTTELKKSRDEVTTLRAQISSLEDRLGTHDRQVTTLREELTIKTALHTSSQSLVQSLRDQTHELSTQARESSTRAENLEEELAESQRMLSERTREGQTMRMLLNQTETGTETRVREMKERMDAAIEERDRIEDEASVSNRRMMRELDEAKSKARDAQRALKVLEDEKDELEVKSRDSRRRLTELEQAADRAGKEVEDLRAAMAGLREALNESERQVQEMETQKAELRRVGEEARERAEKLTKSNKTLTEEMKALQTTVKKQQQVPRPGLDSGRESSRTSVESSSARSPAPMGRDRPSEASGKQAAGAAGLSQGTVDYVYLKNVLLQFLEQKDKAHQRQLIPVLGMLLHFDRKDEQRWMSAISTR